MRTLAYSLLASILLFTISVAQQSKQKAPNFSLKTADGKTVELARLKGKVVLVNFWATWCGPCRKEMPDFVEVYKQKKSKGLEIVSISLDREGWKVVIPFVKQYGINFPVVVGNAELADAYGGMEYIPTTFIVDRSGMIVDKHIGMMPKQLLEQKLQPLLKDQERIQ
jgi:cytochrome c biogenesis protein CcmG/thiol:disulfide interchange protein DsbE